VDKFLSDNRVLLFIGSMLAGIGGWGVTADTWADLGTPKALFGLLIIVGGVFTANITSNVLKKAPTIIETTEPGSSTVVTTTTTTPANQAGAKP
jgi:hypothetical protein